MRHPVITAVSIAGGLVLLLVVALAVALATVDVNRLLPLLVERVKAETGRELRVEGGAALKRSTEPRLELRDVVVANAAWGRAPALVRAKRLDVQLALWPLLQRRVEIREIVLVEPTIALETDPAGRRNWELESRTARTGAAAEAGAPVRTAIVLGEMRIEHGTASYGSAEGTPLAIDIERLVVHAVSRDRPVDADFKGSIAGIPLTVTVHTGPIALVSTSGTPLPLRVEGEIAGRKAKLDTAILSDDAGIRLDPLALALGESTLSGSVLVRGAARPRVVVKAAAPKLNVADFALTRSPPSQPTRPPGDAGRTATSSTIIPDAALPLDFVRDLSAQGTLTIDELIAGPQGHARGVQLAFVAGGGKLDISRFEASTWGGKLEGRGAIEVGASSPRVELHLAGHDLDLGSVLALAGSPREVKGGKTALRLDAVARGASPHAWASTATGDFELLVGAATLVDPKRDAASTLTQLSAAVNPLHGTERATELKCAVVRIPLANGVGRFDRTVAIETQTLGASATGTVDLRDETFDVAVHPSLRQGIPLDIGQVADLVRVRGGWRAPRVTVDATSSVATVARLGAVVATGGVAALGGLFVLGSATENGPCAVASGAASARKAPARDKPAPTANPAQDLLQGIGRLFQR